MATPIQYKFTYSCSGSPTTVTLPYALPSGDYAVVAEAPADIGTWSVTNRSQYSFDFTISGTGSNIIFHIYWDDRNQST